MILHWLPLCASLSSMLLENIEIVVWSGLGSVRGRRGSSLYFLNREKLFKVSYSSNRGEHNMWKLKNVNWNPTKLSIWFSSKLNQNGFGNSKDKVSFRSQISVRNNQIDQKPNFKIENSKMYAMSSIVFLIFFTVIFIMFNMFAIFYYDYDS